MKQIFFSDVDGTLLAHLQEVSEAVRSAAIEYQRRGGLLALCTGRSVKSLLPVANALQIALPCIVCCGAGIYDIQDDRYIWHANFQDDILERLHDVLRAYPSIAVQAFTLDDVLTLNMNGLLARRGIRAEQESGVQSVRAIQGDILKILLASEDVPLLRRCCTTHFSGGDYTVEAASTHFVEITPAGVDKGTAVRKFLTLLRLEGFTICAAGDGRTDLPLLREAALRFAPENAKPELKAICHHIVPAAGEGGMAAAFSIAAERLRGGPDRHPLWPCKNNCTCQ